MHGFPDRSVLASGLEALLDQAMRILGLTVIAACLGASPAPAQLCTGSASFTDGRFQVSSAAGFSEDATAFGAGFAYGGKTPFGEISVGTTSFSATFDGQRPQYLNGSSVSVAAGGGYQFQLGTKGKVHVCPTAAVTYSAGPNDVNIFGFGASLGVVAGQTPRYKIIPHASFDLVTSSITVGNETASTPHSRTEFFGLLGLGLGIVLNRVTLHPGVGIPVGLEGAPISFGAAIGLNFGPVR